MIFALLYSCFTMLHGYIARYYRSYEIFVNYIDALFYYYRL